MRLRMIKKRSVVVLSNDICYDIEKCIREPAHPLGKYGVVIDTGRNGYLISSLCKANSPAIVMLESELIPITMWDIPAIIFYTSRKFVIKLYQKISL